ncbi:MAG TPA: TIR domain-containing protein, partial [Pirellulaceae bacterium]|nr:TIR domain-containing protein [Pirellulaceae bacterium]
MPPTPARSCDVFLSYATANNQEIISGKPGWVTQLHVQLRKFLDEKERRGAFDLFMDSRLRGNERFDDQLTTQVVGAGVMVVVLSEAYLASTWCRRELELFGRGGEAVREKRIFLVHYEPVPAARWPRELEGLSESFFRFYEREEDDTVTTPLGHPTLLETDRTYFKRLRELREQMYQQLRQPAVVVPDLASAGVNPNLVVRARGASWWQVAASGIRRPTAAGLGTFSRFGSETAMAFAPALDPTSSRILERGGERDSGSELAATATPAARRGVLLAEVWGDSLSDQRERLRSHLEDTGLLVLPTDYYSRSPTEFSAALDRDLERSCLFVQLLGPRFSPATADLPGGYEQLQLERARAAGIPILRWRSRDLKLDDLPSSVRGVLEGEDVEALYFDDLVRTIVQRALQSSLQAAASDDDRKKFVLVDAEGSDDETLSEVRQRLEECEIGCDFVPPGETMLEAADARNYDGLMVVVGNSDRKRVDDHLRSCRQLMLTRKHKPPACALLVASSGEDESMPPVPQRITVIKRDDDHLRSCRQLMLTRKHKP